jgi:UDP-glucose 4-epimerase
VRHENELGLQPAAHWQDGWVSSAALARAALSAGFPEIIVHAAGGSAVGASVVAPDSDFDRTVASVREVLGFMRTDASAARLIFLSSAAVYGATSADKVSENAPLSPISPYGLHKRLAEELLCGWAGIFGLDVSIIRLFSVFGPGNRKQLFWDLARRALDRPAMLQLSGTGDEARDFLYIDDAVRYVGSIAGLPRASSPRIVNGGTGRATSVRAAALALCSALGIEAQLDFSGEERAGDPRRLVSDPGYAKSLGIEPEVSFKTGVESYAAWLERVLTGAGRWTPGVEANDSAETG